MYLTEDIIDPWRRLLGRKDDTVILIADHAGVYIVQTVKGVRFAVSKDKVKE